MINHDSRKLCFWKIIVQNFFKNSFVLAIIFKKKILTYNFIYKKNILAQKKRRKLLVLIQLPVDLDATALPTELNFLSDRYQNFFLERQLFLINHASLKLCFWKIIVQNFFKNSFILAIIFNKKILTYYIILIKKNKSLFKKKRRLLVSIQLPKALQAFALPTELNPLSDIYRIFFLERQLFLINNARRKFPIISD